MRKASVLFIVFAVNVSFAGSIYTLVSHWAFDEGSGTTIQDSGTGRHNGTVYGNPVWSSGKIGGCLDLDGDGDVVNMGDIDAFEFGNNNFTVSFWFNTQGAHNYGGNQGSYGIIVGKYNMHLGRQWTISQEPDNRLNFSTWDTSSSSSGDSCRSTESYYNKWVFCTAVRDGSTKYLYIDGVLDNTGICDGIVTGKTTPLLIGANSVYTSIQYYECFNGLVDDVRIYDYALSAGDVYQLYTIPEPVSMVLFAIGSLAIISRNIKL